MKRLFLLIPLPIVLLAVLFWSQQRTGPFFVSGLIESHQIRVGSRVGGRVQTIHADEGQRVKQGTPLLTLEPFDLRARLTEAQAALAARQATLARLRAGARPEELAASRAELARVEAALAKLVAGPRPQEVDAARAQLRLAEADLAKARKDFDRVQKLAEHGRAAEEETDEVVRALAAAEARVDAAKATLSQLEEGSRVEDVAEARAHVDEARQSLALLEAGARKEDIAEAEAMAASAQAAVSVIEQQLTELTVVAPSDCVVEAADLRPGDLVGANAPVIALSDPAELWVRAFLPENRLDVEVGRKVRVRVDSLPERRFAGHVTFVSRDAEFTPSNVQTPDERSKQVFRIKVVLDEGHDVLRAGMAADVFLEPEP